MSDVTMPKGELMKVMELCAAGSMRLYEYKERIEQLDAELVELREEHRTVTKAANKFRVALDDIRLALDSQYGPDAWSIDRVLTRVGR